MIFWVVPWKSHWEWIPRLIARKALCMYQLFEVWRLKGNVLCALHRMCAFDFPICIFAYRTVSCIRMGGSFWGVNIWSTIGEFWLSKQVPQHLFGSVSSGVVAFMYPVSHFLLGITPYWHIHLIVLPAAMASSYPERQIESHAVKVGSLTEGR